MDRAHLGAIASRSASARAMEICAVLVAVGGVLAFLTIREGKLVREVTQSVASAPCGDPCLGEGPGGELRAAS